MVRLKILRVILSVGVMLTVGATAIVPQAAGYKIDYRKSSIRFKANARFLNVNGFFRKWSFQGKLPGDLKATGRLRIRVASLDTDNSTRDKHLRNPDFFDVKKHPYADFTIRSVNVAGNSVTVRGRLKLRGVSKTVTIKFKKSVKGSAIILTGRTWIKRKSYNISYDSSINPIKDLVRLDFRIVLVGK